MAQKLPITVVTSRRIAVTTALLALSGAAVARTAERTAGFVAKSGENPDADMIALCDRHIRNWAALNGAPSVPDDDPLWDAYDASAAEVGAARAESFGGCVAKARALRVEVLQRDGTLVFEGRTEDWAWDLINDLIRIGGRA